MAHLWLHTTEQEWMVIPLAGEVWTLTGQHDQPGQLIQAGRATSDGHGSVLLKSSQGSGKDEIWVLLVPPMHGVCINGEKVVLGICTLSDKDETRVPGRASFFFSTEKLACVEPFPSGSGQRFFCPRCKQDIPPTSLAMRCPQCGVWHHQSDDLPCWSYGEHCTLCDQPSDLDADYRWTPEEL